IRRQPRRLRPLRHASGLSHGRRKPAHPPRLDGKLLPFRTGFHRDLGTMSRPSESGAAVNRGPWLAALSIAAFTLRASAQPVGERPPIVDERPPIVDERPPIVNERPPAVADAPSDEGEADRRLKLRTHILRLTLGPRAGYSSSTNSTTFVGAEATL